MRVLALVHQDDAPPGTFGDVVAHHGHDLEVRSLVPGAGEGPPRDAAKSYGAVMLFGGSMQVDQDDERPVANDEHRHRREALGDAVALVVEPDRSRPC